MSTAPIAHRASLVAVAIAIATSAHAQPGGTGATATSATSVNATSATSVNATSAMTANATTAAAVTARLTDKKAAYLAAKQAATRPPKIARSIGKPAGPVINLRNTWTKEWLVLDVDARKAAAAEAQIDRFLRDHYTNGPTAMDKRLLGILRDAARHFSASRIEIVSGFRAPKYNLMLRKKGHEVARDSQHTHGNAVDFRIPGVGIDALHAWARAQRIGGVGLYRGSGFIHMDTGRIRYWGGE